MILQIFENDFLTSDQYLFIIMTGGESDFENVDDEVFFFITTARIIFHKFLLTRILEINS